MAYQSVPAVQPKKLYHRFDSTGFYFDVLDLLDLLELTNVAFANLHLLRCSFRDSMSLGQRFQMWSWAVWVDRILLLLVLHTDYTVVDWGLQAWYLAYIQVRASFYTSFIGEETKLWLIYSRISSESRVSICQSSRLISLIDVKLAIKGSTSMSCLK